MKHKCYTMTKLSDLGLSSLKLVNFMGPEYVSFAHTAEIAIRIDGYMQNLMTFTHTRKKQQVCMYVYKI